MENIMLTVIQLMGGLGLFIYGMKLMGDGLENIAGDGLKSILEKVTKNRIFAVTVGAVVTAVIQSSSATTVMVVGFVNAGLMNLAQAAGIIMGANIGTTITAQLVAFKLDEIAPLFIFVGAFMGMFIKNKRKKELGSIILGFGILFSGMGMMSTAMKPLAETPQFTQMIMLADGKWLLGIAIGALLTAVLQSSSATTGILVALAMAGTIDIHFALPILFGCNIGTCITAMIATVGTNKTAHKAALIHLLFNLIGTIIFIPFLGILGRTVESISPGEVNRQIANAHTIFNIVNTLVLLPFIGLLIKFVNKVIPGEDEIEEMGSKYIDDRLLETPVIAAGQVSKETVRMANKAKRNLELAMEAFVTNDEKLVEKVYENEKLINILNEQITTYLVKLAKCDLSGKESEIVAATFHIINDIERIGDHADNVAELTAQKIEKKLEYSKSALADLENIYNNTLTAIDIAIQSYENKDASKANEIFDVESNIDKLQRRYRDLHIKRLYEGTCNAYAGTIYLDIISNLERIGDHSTNIAQSVMENN